VLAVQCRALLWPLTWRAPGHAGCPCGTGAGRRLHRRRRSLAWRCALSAFAARAQLQVSFSANRLLHQFRYVKKTEGGSCQGTRHGAGNSLITVLLGNEQRVREQRSHARRSGGPISGRSRPTAWRCCSWRPRASRCSYEPAACSFGCRPRWPSFSGARPGSSLIIALCAVR